MKGGDPGAMEGTGRLIELIAICAGLVFLVIVVLFAFSTYVRIRGMKRLRDDSLCTKLGETHREFSVRE